MADIDDGSFPCPRCGAHTVSDFYGPCDSCARQLRDQFSGLGRDVEAARYEPKMNVVPNQVASKD